MVLGPATEEATKLLMIVVVGVFTNFVKIWLFRTTKVLRVSLASPAEYLLLIPVAIGVFFGLWEHFTGYPWEPTIPMVVRVAAHTGYTCVAFATCLAVWRRGHRAWVGLWVGILAGMVPHALFNLGPVAPPEWPVHAFIYAFVIGLSSLSLGLLFLNRALRHEPGSVYARVLLVD
jgi:hypothetical protein